MNAQLRWSRLGTTIFWHSFGNKCRYSDCVCRFACHRKVDCWPLRPPGDLVLNCDTSMMGKKAALHLMLKLSYGTESVRKYTASLHHADHPSKGTTGAIIKFYCFRILERLFQVMGSFRRGWGQAHIKNVWGGYFKIWNSLFIFFSLVRWVQYI